MISYAQATVRMTGCFLVCLLGGTLHADAIQLADIVPLDMMLTGSGNGTLDLRMMTFSGSEIDNASGSFNGDNGNNNLAQGGGANNSMFAESYFTRAIEIQDFYRLNFPDGNGGSTVNELAIFLDLNETGQAGSQTNTFSVMDMLLNAATVQGNPDPSLDILSSAQDAIDQQYTGGTLIANLASPPVNLPVVQQGAGFADYAILTGIDPFSLNPSDTLLLNVSFSNLNSGAEEFFLSGDFRSQDVLGIPEPSIPLIHAFAFAMLARGRRRTTRRTYNRNG